MWIADSYAKINLGLHVLERLPTGYHRIESGFCFINWRDRFEVQQASEMKLDIDEEKIESTISDDDSNLINKAISVLDRYVGLKQHYQIKVEKRIPVGAGLGGGSSNAALTLRMLNKIEELGLNNDELIDLSRDIGADVPFFIKGVPAIGRGLGQELEPCAIQPEWYILTCFPGEPSSTTKAYEQCIPNPQPDFNLEKTLLEAPMDEWRYTLINDLEPAVFPRHRISGNLKDQMYEFGAIYASMTGSGSAVYGIFEQEFVATSAYQDLLELELSANLTKPAFKPDYGIYRKA